MSARPKTIFFACSALGKELRAIIHKHGWNADFHPIDARHEGAVRPVGSHCYKIHGGDDFRRAVKEEPGTCILTDFLVRAWGKFIVGGLKIDKHPKLAELMFGH